MKRCGMPLPSDGPAAAALDRLWTKCLADQESGPWTSHSGKVGILAGAPGTLCPTFQAPGEELPSRGKLTHEVGAVGLVEWREVGNHPYTGVFKVVICVNHHL
jgi:hypothetical protein